MSDMIGAVLAGGRGARLGGEGKAMVELAGRPLLDHAVDALRAVVRDVIVVAKWDTPLPERLTVPFWPDTAEVGGDHHPRLGIVSGLRYAEPLPLLVLAVDLPLVPRDVLEALRATTTTTVTRTPDGRLQPLCAVYAADALATLQDAPPDEPLTRTVERLQPDVLDVPADALLNVNTPDDLAAAEARLASP